MSFVKITPTTQGKQLVVCTHCTTRAQRTRDIDADGELDADADADCVPDAVLDPDGEPDDDADPVGEGAVNHLRGWER